jgi:protein phosphatase
VPLVECLRNATVYANLAIHHRSQSDSRCSGMGATFTGAAIKDGVLDLVQVGDSRAYMLRGDEIKLVTKINPSFSSLSMSVRSQKKKPRHTCFAT